MLDKLKSIPVPIWIGLAIVVIVVLLLNNKSASSAQQQQPVSASTPVNDQTVGAQGSQAGAGTDQELANLSQITQGGFAQIQNNERVQTGLLTQIRSGMTGVGTPMQQFGGAIQTSQNGWAMDNATQWNNPQPVSSPNSTPNTPSTPTPSQ